MKNLILSLLLLCGPIPAQEIPENWNRVFAKEYMESAKKDFNNPTLLRFSRAEYDKLPSIECDMQDHNGNGVYRVDVKFKKIARYNGCVIRPIEKRFTVSVKENYSPDDIFVVYRKIDGRIEQGLVYLSK